MARWNVLVKISGDLFKTIQVRNWIAGLSKKSYVVVYVGGGKQINEEFLRRGFPIKKKGPLGRETDTFEERQVARDILERNAMECEDFLPNRTFTFVSRFQSSTSVGFSAMSTVTRWCAPPTTGMTNSSSLPPRSGKRRRGLNSEICQK